jgi:hypothetical protein
MNFTLESLHGNAKTPHWYVNQGDKQWHVIGLVTGSDVHVVSVSSRYYTEQTKSHKEVKLKQGTAAYEAAAKAARDFWLGGTKTAVTDAIVKLSGAEKLEAADRVLSISINVSDPDLANHPIAKMNAASWPSGKRAPAKSATPAVAENTDKPFEAWKEPVIPVGCQITVNSVKGHGNGTEGPRWSCKVQFKGQPAGEADENGDGGPLRWFPVTPAQGKAMQEYARTIGFNLGQQENAEHLIATLVGQAKEMVRFERLLKTSIIIKLANGKVVQYKRAAWTDQFAKTVLAKDPGAIELSTAAAVAEALKV